MTDNNHEAGAPALLTLSETARRLGKSDAQLRWMLHRGTAPNSALIGGRRMFRSSDVEAYIERAFQVPDAAAHGHEDLNVGQLGVTARLLGLKPSQLLAERGER